ncbi:uncharacterized protein LOC121378978 isoform X2 [Gigantopelta aegis]|uniref:uncharacterized protein LOC121378978 isoform X2 n=1 Tax=Gigantopelta aegis TaxID=1735272 RepID=UPI001B88D614|nr:uncharacterized protein LOC121378978 isoform X2 [Gigantopelta aegis]
MSEVRVTVTEDASCFRSVRTTTKLACKQMARMHSPRTQCCCCAGNIFFMLFGILMLSTGASLVLNYGQLEVDTGGLPPGLQNEEGKRIVGIILICCGFVAMGISALMGALYFTVCSRPKPPRNTIAPNTTSTSASHGAASKKSRDSRDSSGVALPSNTGNPRKKSHSVSMSETNVNKSAGNYSVSANQSKHGSGGIKQKRSRKKRNSHNLKHGIFKTPLAPHQEHDEEFGIREDIALHDSVRSVDSSLSASTDTRKSSLDADVKPSMVISVTSIVGEVKPFLGPVPELQTIGLYTDLMRHSQGHGSWTAEAIPSDTVITVDAPSSEPSVFQTTGL